MPIVVLYSANKQIHTNKQRTNYCLFVIYVLAIKHVGNKSTAALRGGQVVLWPPCLYTLIDDILSSGSRTIPTIYDDIIMALCVCVCISDLFVWFVQSVGYVSWCSLCAQLPPRTLTWQITFLHGFLFTEVNDGLLDLSLHCLQNYIFS